VRRLTDAFILRIPKSGNKAPLQGLEIRSIRYDRNRRAVWSERSFCESPVSSPKQDHHT
jgi:hypothetical protein